MRQDMMECKGRHHHMICQDEVARYMTRCKRDYVWLIVISWDFNWWNETRSSKNAQTEGKMTHRIKTLGDALNAEFLHNEYSTRAIFHWNNLHVNDIYIIYHKLLEKDSCIRVELHNVPYTNLCAASFFSIKPFTFYVIFSGDVCCKVSTHMMC